MTPDDSILLEIASRCGILVLAIGLGLAAYRLLRGPTHADRIIALDLFSVLLVALISLYAVLSREKAFLDVSLAYALVAFLGTVAFARYLERSSTGSPGKSPPPTPGGRRE